MDKTKAVELLNEIAASCQALNIGGFYTRDIRSQVGSVELRLITSLDLESRKRIMPILSKRGLMMQEENGLVIIYEPYVS
jgi:hypothetical protein